MKYYKVERKQLKKCSKEKQILVTKKFIKKHPKYTFCLLLLRKQKVVYTHLIKCLIKMRLIVNFVFYINGVINKTNFKTIPIIHVNKLFLNVYCK